MGSTPQRHAPLLESDALLAGYDGTAVCGVLSVELQSGKALALAGANGSGKSTLLRTLSGRQKPVGGTVQMDGASVDERSLRYRRSVAAVFDDDAFFPALTAGEHLLTTALGHGREDASSAVDNELEFFGLTSHGEAFPHSLSSGQRRRLLLASAFVRPFTLLVLDEPEQRLDQTMRRRLAERLVQSGTAGAGILLATHDPLLLSAVADRCVLLDDDDMAFVAPERAAEVISG
ncbi:ABC transporter ATP-binding protein [Arthrobacter castelli]|uniref:ABC transporter ATP-binding protein n=1 Tax=Arthrobacter castelli TaxID=271431 RepID=UPI0003FFC770|nr:ABC transporter ATP-binding protein [Arthrobacter castelli]